MFRSILTLTIILGLLAGFAVADEADLPEGKRTKLGLYATPAEAYAAWEADPDGVTLIDVRTPEEFLFVGHPEMAWNVPFFEQTYDWDPENGGFMMEPNIYFVADVREIVGKHDTVYLICRSGGRSAMAVDALAAAGFTRAWTVTEGFEGDKVKDQGSPDSGHRTINGWKNAGLPWTYAIERNRMKLPEGN